MQPGMTAVTAGSAGTRRSPIETSARRRGLRRGRFARPRATFARPSPDPAWIGSRPRRTCLPAYICRKDIRWQEEPEQEFPNLARERWERQRSPAAARADCTRLARPRRRAPRRQRLRRRIERCGDGVADVANLSGPLRLVEQRPQLLVEEFVFADGVELIEVDVIGADARRESSSCCRTCSTLRSSVRFMNEWNRWPNFVAMTQSSRRPDRANACPISDSER